MILDDPQEYLKMQYEAQKQQQAQRSKRQHSAETSSEKRKPKPISSRGRSEGEALKASSGNSLSRVKSDGEAMEVDAKEERRSKSRHRHRSKSRSRNLSTNAEQVEEEPRAEGGESLRDYWKRRATEDNGTTAGERATSSKRPGRDKDLDKQLERHRARSKSRGRSIRDTKKSVDSIALALQHKPQSERREEISPLHSALEKSDWNALNDTLISLAKDGNSSDVAAQLSVSYLYVYLASTTTNLNLT